MPELNSPCTTAFETPGLATAANGKEKYDAFFKQFNDPMMAPH
jgi:hypothetical protein